MKKLCELTDTTDFQQCFSQAKKYEYVRKRLDRGSASLFPFCHKIRGRTVYVNLSGVTVVVEAKVEADNKGLSDGLKGSENA